MHPLYETLPLDHSRRSIRLWQFHQTSTDNDLRLKLAVHSFDTTLTPDYFALSYVWGESSDGWSTISVNDIPLKITPNLHDFLRVLHGQPRYNKLLFWADQISMDQSNVAERNHQVQLMSEIFSTASLVMAYLAHSLSFRLFNSQVYSEHIQ